MLYFPTEEHSCSIRTLLSIIAKELTMNCWHCERPAHGACIFCGRAICKEHVREMPHIVALYRDSKNAQKAIVTARALFCGVCEPREDPVEIPRSEERRVGKECRSRW